MGQAPARDQGAVEVAYPRRRLGARLRGRLDPGDRRFFSSHGTCYTARFIDLPASKGFGEPIQKTFKLKDGERIVAVVSFDPRALDGDINEDPKKPDVCPMLHGFAATTDGYALRFGLDKFVEPSTRSGRKFARPASGQHVVGMLAVHGSETILAVTERCRAIVCAAEEVNYLGGPGKGVRLIKVAKDDALLGFKASRGDRDLLTVETNRGAQKNISTVKYRTTSRGGVGTEIQKNGRIKRIVHDEVPAPVLKGRAPKGGLEMAKNYNADQLTVLQGLEAVRKRPGMYIGGANSAGLHHCVGDPRQLHRRGHERPRVGDHADPAQVGGHRDHQRQRPRDPRRQEQEDRQERLELVLTELHAGGKFQNDGSGNYKTSGGLHGVGASVVNALSKRLVATVKRDGAEYRMEFAGGLPRTKLLRKKSGEVRGTGTTIEFTPDPKIFPRTVFNPETLQARLETASFLHSGVKMVFADQTRARAPSSATRTGSALPRYVRDERKAHPIHDEPFYLSKETADARIELVFQWTESTDEHVRSYVNGITTARAEATRTACAPGSTRPSGTTWRPTSSRRGA